MVRCSCLVIFCFEEKFLVSHASASHLPDVYFQSVRGPCGKNNISLYIWHKLLIQTIKYSYFSQVIQFIKVSMARCLRLVIFCFKEKFSVSHRSVCRSWVGGRGSWVIDWKGLLFSHNWNWKLKIENRYCWINVAVCCVSMQIPSTTHDLDTLSLAILLVIS